jgi:hypothetical protein
MTNASLKDKIEVAHPADDGTDEVVGTTIPLVMISGVTEQRPMARDEG